MTASCQMPYQQYQPVSVQMDRRIGRDGGEIVEKEVCRATEGTLLENLSLTA